MPLRLPDDKRIAVTISPHFDAHAMWMGTFGVSTPGVLSRGEFGAEVGVPRLLDLFERFEIPATWFTPTHSMATFPEATKAIASRGHEFAAHGCLHEGPESLDPETELRLMRKTIEQFEQHAGARPRGYGSPAWEFSDSTMDILVECGFEWDASLMGRDFQPYHPRPVILNEDGNTFGPPSPILELPISWYVDDFPALDHIPGKLEGFGPSEVTFQRWKDHFDYAYERETNPMIAYTVHPQCIGRAPNIMMLERLVEYISGHDGVWFATCSEIFDSWVDG